MQQPSEGVTPSFSLGGGGGGGLALTRLGLVPTGFTWLREPEPHGL